MDRMICVDVVVASRLLSVLMADRLAAFDVSLGQLPTLLCLYERDGQTQSELARATSVEQPTMAVNLRRMERDGLVAREPDPTDGRRWLVQLTPLAKDIRVGVQSQREQLDRAALGGVTDLDRNTLGTVLIKMINNLESQIAASVNNDEHASDPETT